MNIRLTVLALSLTLSASCVLATSCLDPSLGVLSGIMAVGSCTTGNITLSSFGYQTVQGTTNIQPANIATTYPLPAPATAIDFSSTPLIYAPSGPVVTEISFTAASSGGKLIDGLDVTADLFSVGETGVVTTFLCLGGPATIAADGTVTCSTGQLLNTSTAATKTTTLNFTGISTVGIVNRISAQPSGGSPGTLTNVVDQFDFTNAVPEPSSLLLMLCGAVALIFKTRRA